MFCKQGYPRSDPVIQVSGIPELDLLVPFLLCTVLIEIEGIDRPHSQGHIWQVKIYVAGIAVLGVIRAGSKVKRAVLPTLLVRNTGLFLVGQSRLQFVSCELD